MAIFMRPLCHGVGKDRRHDGGKKSTDGEQAKIIQQRWQAACP